MRLFLPAGDLLFWWWFCGISKGLPIWPSLQRTGNGLVAEEPPAMADVCGLFREFLVYRMFTPLKSSNSPVSWQKLLSLTDEHKTAPIVSVKRL